MNIMLAFEVWKIVVDLPVPNSRDFDISLLVGLTNHDDLDGFGILARHAKNIKLSKIKLKSFSPIHPGIDSV